MQDILSTRKYHFLFPIKIELFQIQKAVIIGSTLHIAWQLGLTTRDSFKNWKGASCSLTLSRQTLCVRSKHAKWEGIYFHSRSPAATLNRADFTFITLNDRCTVNHLAWELVWGGGHALVFSVWVLTGWLRDQPARCFSRLENTLSMKWTDCTFKINLDWSRCCSIPIRIFKSWSTRSMYLKLPIFSIWDRLNSGSL